MIHHRFRKDILLSRLGRFALIAVLFWSCAAAQIPPEDEMFGYVIGIEGKSHQEREDFIKKQLVRMNIGYFTVPFQYFKYREKDTLDLGGEDIVVRFGRGQKRLVVGAHFDAVEGSPGANDNGGGIAVVIELIKSMQRFPWKCSVDFVFFDREEDGLLGSRFYVQRVVDKKNHYGMINLDVEGTGSEVYVGPVGSGDDDFLMPLVRNTAKQTGFSYKENAAYPGSDYESFAAERLENISVSVVPKGDADLLARMAQSRGAIDPKYMPKVMRVMHTPNDRSDQMSPDALRISYEFTKTLLKYINESIE